MNNNMLSDAVFESNVELVKELLKNKNLTFDPRVFTIAITLGNLAIVKLLLQDGRVNPTAIHFDMACSQGRLGMVRLLLQDPRIDPTALGGSAFIFAVRKRNRNVVRVLLQDGRINPGVNIDAAIAYVVKHNCVKMAKLLLQDHRVGVSRVVGRGREHLISQEMWKIINTRPEMARLPGIFVPGFSPKTYKDTVCMEKYLETALETLSTYTRSDALIFIQERCEQLDLYGARYLGVSPGTRESREMVARGVALGLFNHGATNSIAGHTVHRYNTLSCVLIDHILDQK
ncbi:hypothetical protein SARC_03794 [Sphaeroforma arctica JP610]|uniref:Uncharacterized protein n=1 Tax=Sphaeroforma arctica JP610 TaxID=667725 RepID=A0A0L0G4X2_9EUKA|nr:hypothetical protein SARC_03794 [Sphaeroforma arctica JP610]KNC83974.1 hypothetical protein SARC_03794 [Sphaeroforma arctica JP610]|eukprot:XP_014157876.1 hypothetical protein SARC_03794 [Sphaeroforma arctica JP610]